VSSIELILALFTLVVFVLVLAAILGGRS